MNACTNAASKLGLSSRAFIARAPNGDAPFRYVCNLRDSIQRDVCFMGKYEPQETALVQHFLKPGNVFVDVGANWGYFTLLASSIVGRKGRVISLEPHPRLFELLTKNVELNNFEQVHPLPVAAADRNTELRLEGFDEVDGNWGISRLSSENSTGRNDFKVQSRCVDEVLDELKIGAVELLKMDIEGAEALALRGMIGGLKRHLYKVILLELHPEYLAERGLKPIEAIDPLLSNGYRGWRVRHSFADTRNAAYSSDLGVAEWLEPWNAEMPFDNWPHMLWIAPGHEVAWNS